MCSGSWFSSFISWTESTRQKWVFSLLLLIEILINNRISSWARCASQILIKWSNLSSWRHTETFLLGTGKIYRRIIGQFIGNSGRTCKHLKLAWMEFEVQSGVVESRNSRTGKHHNVGTLFDFPLSILGNEFHLKFYFRAFVDLLARRSALPGLPLEPWFFLEHGQNLNFWWNF